MRTKTLVLMMALLGGGAAQEAPRIPEQQEPAPTPPPLPPVPSPPTPMPQPPLPAADLPAPAVSVKVLDDGLLDPSWFGVPPAFKETKEVDFLWVKPGLNLSGQKIRLRSWEAPLLRKPGRDERDAQKIRELTYLFPIVLRNCLGSGLGAKVSLSSTEGAYVLTGRFVDVNAGSDGAKFFVGFGAGSATATWDMKLVDAQTSELVLAVHHRCISGSAFTGLQDKLEKWSRRFAQVLEEEALH